MKGYFGIGLIAIGIFVAVMGGYILNADTVSTCSTEWEYVTDVGAAFQGDDSDMDVGYNPPENITGWSYKDAYNNGRLSGVDYGDTTATNTYRAVVGDASIVAYSLTVMATDTDGLTRPASYSATVANYGTYSGTMPEEFGLYGPEAVTLFSYGSDTEEGVFAMSLADLPSIVPDYSNIYTLGLSVSTSGIIPCVASVSFSTSGGVFTHSGQTYRNMAFSDVQAIDASDTAVVYCKESVVAFGSTKLPLGSVYLVWGQAQFNGSGVADASVSVTLSATLDDAPWAYVDPAEGVVPVYGTYTSNTMSFVSHATSSTPTVEISFGEHASSNASGAIFADGTEIAQWVWVGSGSAHVWEVTPTGGTQVTQGDSTPTGTLTATVSSGLFTFSFDGASATYQSTSTTFSELSVSLTVTGESFPWTVEITRDNGTATVFSGTESVASPMVGDLSYVSYQPTPTTVQYSTVYWYNGESEQNAQVVMAFTADSLPASNTVLFRGPDGNSPVTIRCDSSGVWTVGSVAIGEWAGIQLTVGYGQMVIEPISQFRTFLDYVTVETETSVYGGTAVGGGTITSIAVSEHPSGSSLRMCVVSTTIHIPEGGLYLQNGNLDMGAAFPGAQAVSVMLGSAAKMGESITFASGGDSETIQVDPDRRMLYIDSRWYDFNGVTFRWYSSTGPSATIDNHTYGPAIYHNGSTYASGKIWAEVDGGKMVEVLDASTTWTMTLDGVWAPSVFFYEGENVASSSVELGDFTSGEYQWDKNTFIIVMMAVSIAGGMIGSYFKFVDAWDWVAIIGTVGVLWVVL